MMNFLIDNQTEYTYNVLLEDINKKRSYVLGLRTNDLYTYFLNVIVALVSNNPLVLIDADINNSELNEIDENIINVNLPISDINAISFEDIINRIKNSTTEISIFTSGTTGQPKKVIHTVQTLTRNVLISERYMNQTWAFAYNPTHMAGLQVFFQTVMNCNTMINVFNKSRDCIYKIIEKYSITHISATPTFYRLLLPFEKTYDSVRRVTFGGEKSDRKLHDLILLIFPNAKLNNIYASTEAGTLFISRGENFQIQLDHIDKIKTEDNELLIHRSLLGKSKSFDFSNDYYHTGDLIKWIDQEKGVFSFVSRKNEIVNVGGYKVNPVEVESIICQMNEVLQVIVYGKQNSVLGNILCADVLLKEFCNLSEFAIRDYLSDKLQDFKIPRIIKFVDSIALTRTGKIKR